VIPVGGNHVTRDISIGLRTPFEIAERLKIERGVASPTLIPHGEALEVMTAGSGERLRLPRAVLGEIIEARMIELFEMSRDAIGVSRLQKRVPAGVILSGGGALLPGAIELAQQVFDLPVRLGKPVDLDGWSDQVDSPQYATAVGLLRFALRQQAAQMGNGAMSALGVVGVDPQRRIWSVPVPSPHRSTEEMAQHNIAFQNEAAQAKSNSQVNGAAQGGSTPDNYPASERAETPFDRAATDGAEYSQSDVHAAEMRGEDGEKYEEPLWQKWLAKLRQLIGFE
jgi:cell division ATPase FtsA